MLRIALALTATLSLWAVAPAMAQDTPDRRPSHCIALVQNTPGLEVIHRASLSDPLDNFTVQIGYVDHAMLVIRTQGGTTAVTDYAGYLGTADFVPDVVTMNKAHSTHWTANPDPRIPHVLKGWGDDYGQPANRYLDLGDMVVRTVSTDIRSMWSDLGEQANSIFIFEVDGLCIGHLGHLHHEPTAEQYAAIGRLDVVMAPVDGGYTIPQTTMIEIMQRLRSSIVIPMHWFGRPNLDRFLAGMESDFIIDRRGESFMEVSLRTLPSSPTVVVLEPAFINGDDD
ncbi:MAG: MBL fold metallo-hydrolase [Pseudomonadota bacterium]